MHQITQKLKNGQMKISDVPLPSLQKGCVLVRNYYSLNQCRNGIEYS